MDHFEIETPHVAGWCSGAQVATKLAATYPGRVQTLVLLNGIFSLKDRSCTSEFMSVLAATMGKVARSRKYADMYFRLNFGAKQKDLPDIEPGSLDLEYDPALFHLTSFPFKDPESLFQYANLVKCMVSENTDDWIGQIQCPTLIVSGGKDITAGPQSSRKIAQQIASNASFHEIETADHYSICYDDQVSMMIDRFIQSCREGDSTP